MTIGFAANSKESHVGTDFPKLMQLLEGAMIKSDHNWDLRTVYSSLAGLAEVYREALRSIMKDKNKDEFDAYIDSINIVITSHISNTARPMFEQIMSDVKNE